MRMLVTGGTGFIASNLAMELAMQGHGRYNRKYPHLYGGMHADVYVQNYTTQKSYQQT